VESFALETNKILSKKLYLKSVIKFFKKTKTTLSLNGVIKCLIKN